MLCHDKCLISIFKKVKKLYKIKGLHSQAMFALDNTGKSKVAVWLQPDQHVLHFQNRATMWKMFYMETDH